MKKALLFVILVLVMAVWLSAMVCVITGAEVSPKWLSLTEPYVCPPGTKIEAEQTRQSYHEPGETSLSISCIGDGVDQDVTIEAGLALWIVFFLLSLPVASLLVFGGWLLFRWRRRAVQAQAAVQVSGQTVNAVVYEGQSYTNVDDMPPHVREAYGKATAVFSDADGDGIPDILQGGAQVIDLRQQRQEGGGMQRLKELKKMLDAGLITLEEYEAKKNETPLPTLAPTAKPVGSWPPGQYKNTGPEVVAIQYLLRAEGYSLSADGKFGPQTQSAVKNFQQKKGLAVDGIVGPNTWKALVQGHMVKSGSSGDAVRAVQYLLVHKHGYSLTADGTFGKQTEAAVRDLQKTYGLVVDGVVGQNTWKALVAGL